MTLQTQSQNDLATDAQELFNADEAIALVGGDCELFQDLVNLFLDDCPRQLASLREAIERQCPLELQKSAHHLKGSAAHSDPDWP